MDAITAPRVYPFHIHGTTECARCAERLQPGRRAYWWDRQRFCAHCIQVVPDPPQLVLTQCGNDRCQLCYSSGD